MSDGPHKSLPMRPGWKRFAERAYKPAFSIEEIREAVPAALKGDWQEENMPGFVAELAHLFESQLDFFCDQTVKLEGLRKAAYGSPFRCALLDYAIQVATNDHSGGEEGCMEAVRQALSDCVDRGARQVEEHYYRRPRENDAVDVRGRVENAIAGLDIAAVARRLCGIDRNEQFQSSRNRRPLTMESPSNESRGNAE